MSIDVLVLNFKAMVSARVKVRKKDFCIVLAGKQQKCHDRAPLIKKFIVIESYDSKVYGPN